MTMAALLTYLQSSTAYVVNLGLVIIIVLQVACIVYLRRLLNRPQMVQPTISEILRHQATSVGSSSPPPKKPLRWPRHSESLLSAAPLSHLIYEVDKSLSFCRKPNRAFYIALYRELTRVKAMSDIRLSNVEAELNASYDARKKIIQDRNLRSIP